MMLNSIYIRMRCIVRVLSSHKYKILLGSFGRNSIILHPMSIDNPKRIFIGEHVLIQHYVWLAANAIETNKTATLKIEDNVTLGHFNHIYSTGSIIIEKGVLTADRVYIGDIIHSYHDITIPVKDQKAKNIGNVVIGEGSWIGENVSIIGANIGKHCIIGANSVVLHDIPDYSVAVGSPAKVIKRYNQESQEWLKV